MNYQRRLKNILCILGYHAPLEPYMGMTTCKNCLALIGSGRIYKLRYSPNKRWLVLLAPSERPQMTSLKKELRGDNYKNVS